MDNRPIGVFDSGLGGLTVVRALKKLLPNESIIYFGDTARLPYGVKSNDLDKQYSVIQEKKIKLGHQTIWIEEDNTGESAPVTLDVSAYIPVFVANHTISRKEKLIPNMFTQKNWLLNRDFDRYVQDIREVEGTMSIQVIKKGKALTDSMIKNRPDIFKGDIVGVELISGNVTVETKGVVKKDGYLGRTAEVILDRTG